MYWLVQPLTGPPGRLRFWGGCGSLYRGDCPCGDCFDRTTISYVNALMRLHRG